MDKNFTICGFGIPLLRNATRRAIDSAGCKHNEKREQLLGSQKE
jgi:hypothetical protein